jgi:mRNA interferase HicA
VRANEDSEHRAPNRKKRGKESHVTLYFGDRTRIVRDPKDELKTGTLHAMLQAIGHLEE